MVDWNPNSYLKFRDERTQPSIDLVSRIEIVNPGSIIDIGCGPGNSTQVLLKRWPNADIVGLDNSQEMIAKAKSDYPGRKWILADAAHYDPKQSFDIVFSNATLQWIQDHEKLISRLYSFLKTGGALAVQVPANNESPLHNSLRTVSKDDRWSKFTGDCDGLLNYQSASYYYDILVSLSSKIDLWETTYYHILSHHQALIEWYRSTGMRPFLERLPDDYCRMQFEDEVLNGCRESYKVQKDGKMLYPFNRIFFIAYKS
jgi:trans-aconitate 2-methyltransferase